MVSGSFVASIMSTVDPRPLLPSQLELASIVDLCNLLGHLKDTWLRDPQKLLEMVKSEDENPLRGLLLPPREIPVDESFGGIRHSSFKYGDRVTCEMPDGFFDEFVINSGSEVHHLKDRKSFPATVVEVQRDEVRVNWDGDIFRESESTLSADKIAYEADDSGTNTGVDLLIQEKRLRQSGLLRLHKICDVFFVLDSLALGLRYPIPQSKEYIPHQHQHRHPQQQHQCHRCHQCHQLGDRRTLCKFWFSRFDNGNCLVEF